MKHYRYTAFLVLAILMTGTTSAAKAGEIKAIAASVPDRLDMIDFCDTDRDADGLFQTLPGGHLCITDALKGSVANAREKISLSSIGASYLAARQRDSVTPLPLPLQVLGAMVADNLTTYLEARHASPALPQPSPLAARDFPSNEREPANWAAMGLARAQAAGSCEAVTVGLFKRLARDTNLSVAQRMEAGRVLRAFGVANLHPDDRCVA